MTVEEVLRQSGFSDQQIAVLDHRAIVAFSGVLTEAQQARDAAELAQRSNVDFYENRIAPSLANWEEEKSRIENEKARTAAELAYYRTQAEEAKKMGFIASDAPGFQPNDVQGGYMAGAPGGTPGSPQFFDVNRVYERAGDAVGVISDIQWEHQRLFGQPLPVSPSELVRRADAVRLDPRTFAARQFGRDTRRQELQKQEQERHDQKIREEATAVSDRKWAERIGSNPDVRMPQENVRMTEIARGVRSGTRLDPLMLNDQERRRATAMAIRTELAEEAR
jgi:hypothetical protein